MSSSSQSSADMPHTDHGPAILGVAISTTVAAVIAVCIRLYVRIRVTDSLGWDDGFIFGAMLLSVVGAVFSGLMFDNGAGKHSYDLQDPATQVPNVVKWNTAYQADNVICVNLIKLSILIFVLRFVKKKRARYTIFAVMLIMSVVNIVSFSAVLAQCTPLEKLWLEETPGRCLPRNFLMRVGYAQCTVNILTDFFCTLTPIFALWKVKIKTRLKVGICGLMSLGLLATVAAILRMTTLATLVASDYTYSTTDIIITAILEQNIGIIAACMPVYGPVFMRALKQIQQMSSRSSEPRGKSAPDSPRQGLPDEKHYGRTFPERQTSRPESLCSTEANSSVGMLDSDKSSYHSYVVAVNK